MIGRIASFHNYQSTSNDMMRQQVNVQRDQEKLASGKRVLTSGDDPVASIYIQNFSQQDTQIDNYINLITLARNRQTRAEIAMADAEQLTDNAKRQVLEMINGALSDEGRKAHQQDLKGIFNNFMNLANGKDESGNYLFSGTQYSTQPFHIDHLNQVTYAGDSYYRMAQIGQAVEVQTSDPGDEIFMNINNPFGDYQPDYQLSNGSTLLLNRAKNSNHSDKANYEIIFTTNSLGNMEYSLKQNGNLVEQAEYNSKEGIEWGTLNISFSGEVSDGDGILLTPQNKFSVFDTFKRGLALATASIFDTSSTAELQQVIEEFSAAYIHFNQSRAEVGTRLNMLDKQENMHEDLKLVLNRSLGTMSDLDYPSAVIELNENLLALKASQQAFAKTKDLTLFNYL